MHGLYISYTRGCIREKENSLSRPILCGFGLATLFDLKFSPLGAASLRVSCQSRESFPPLLLWTIYCLQLLLLHGRTCARNWIRDLISMNEFFRGNRGFLILRFCALSEFYFCCIRGGLILVLHLYLRLDDRVRLY